MSSKEKGMERTVEKTMPRNGGASQNVREMELKDMFLLVQKGFETHLDEVSF